MSSSSLEQRFWQKVDQRGPEECWPWTSALNYRKYGVFWVGGVKRNEFAHRLMFRMTKGGIPAGMVVMHSCDNPSCVNPSHLSVGTDRDNKLDSVAKKRHAHGETNGGGVKLTEAQVVEIKEMIALGASANVMAKRFHVDRFTIMAIRKGRIWRHVNPPEHPDTSKYAGLKLNNYMQPLSQAEVNRAHELRKTIASCVQIGKQMGRSDVSVRKMLSMPVK